MQKSIAGMLLVLGAVGCNFAPFVQGPNSSSGIGEGPVGPGVRSGPQPSFGAPVSQREAPPPLSGGTLLALRSGEQAFAADPDRDRAYLIDLREGADREVRTIPLRAHDEPGRAVEDNDRRVHVLLRRGGAVVTIDTQTGAELLRRDVCSAPRGIAFVPETNLLHVACAGGEFVTLAAHGGPVQRSAFIERDLRDVVYTAGALYVSTFRRAEVLRVDASGTVLSRTRPPSVDTLGGQRGTFNEEGGALLGTDSAERGVAEPAVAWRMVSLGESVALVHQRGTSQPVKIQQGGYGSVGGCGDGLVHSTVSIATSNTSMQPGPVLPGSVLPVDLAIDATRQVFAVVSAGNAKNPAQPQVMLFDRSQFTGGPSCAGTMSALPSLPGEVTSVAFAGAGSSRLLVQLREPAQLLVFNTTEVRSSFATPRAITLSDESRADTGHAVFHANTGAGLACASCHPEGGDDGRVWQFDGIGPRRTQNFRGGLLGTEPFHWDGDQSDLTHLMSNVFTTRMSGPELSATQVRTLATWIDRVPSLPTARMENDAQRAAVERGRALYNDPVVACATCHSGERLTNNQTVEVGTGSAFQVPTLRGIAWHAPYMHDGCARTLRERFNPTCGGGDRHGRTSHLNEAQLADLVSYLETL